MKYAIRAVLPSGKQGHEIAVRDTANEVFDLLHTISDDLVRAGQVVEMNAGEVTSVDPETGRETYTYVTTKED